MQIAAYDIRSLVTSIEVHPCEERGQVELFVKGVIAGLLSGPLGGPGFPNGACCRSRKP